MKPIITKAEGRAYLARWKLVNEAEIEELRSTPPEEKLRQLAALMASVEALGWSEPLQAGEAEVRERWRRLRKAWNG